MENKLRRCCFAGHSNVYDTDNVYSALKEKIEDLIVNKNVKEFWVGNYGDFDHMCGRCVRELKEKYSDIKLYLIIPYLTKAINEYPDLYKNKYDNILIADIPLNTPTRFKITKCNQYMVDECDYIICYVKNPWGGAQNTLKYAQTKKKRNI